MTDKLMYIPNGDAKKLPLLQITVSKKPNAPFLLLRKSLGLNNLPRSLASYNFMFKDITLKDYFNYINYYKKKLFKGY